MDRGGGEEARSIANIQKIALRESFFAGGLLQEILCGSRYVERAIWCGGRSQDLRDTYLAFVIVDVDENANHTC